MQYHPGGNAGQVLDRLMSLESCVDDACRGPAIGYADIQKGPWAILVGLPSKSELQNQAIGGKP